VGEGAGIGSFVGIMTFVGVGDGVEGVAGSETIM
jgi:hypothetical protein